ncbi:hypothetical protein D9M72_431230 [compost metagenome]
MLQLVQTLLQAAGEALLLLGGQHLLGQVAGIEQGSGQRRADLVGQGRDHASEGGKAFVAGQLILQATGFRQVIEQYQLAGFAIEGAGSDGNPAAILEGDFMAVVFARGEIAGDHFAPEHAHQGLAKQAARHRVGFAHHALPVDHNDTAGQQVQQALQAVGEAFLLRQLLHALGTDQGQLALQLGDPRLQHAVGLAELGRHLVEQRKGLFKTGAAGLLGLGGLRILCGDYGVAHALLSLHRPSADGRSREI